ncbi:MAG TPA: TfuA-like protein [Candidatus Nitrosopolaris sp.]|nr:TfuA-like protein [Candidatus Nitrosopolaris sp.]
MSVVIFAGPTISAAEARSELDAEYLPPAAEGDVYRAARKRPQVIGIIDGYFERVPSVWHKEILWAMSQGIHVFGSASMGALRAAELEAFGMEGVGSIFEAFRDGILEDDDEVAVVHATAEFAFRPASEAMVDIRCTLARARQTGILSAATSAALERVAKSMFYPDRSYSLICRRAVDLGQPRAEVSAFMEWLPEGRASQKHADALAMVRVIRERVANGIEPKRVEYAFENSSMWEQAWRLAGETGRGPVGKPEPILLETVLDELRLEGDAFKHAQQAAILRCLAISQSYVQGLAELAPAAYPTHTLWQQPGVSDAAARAEWMRANNLDEVQLAGLLDDEARVRWITGLAAFEAMGYYLDHLRASGEYPRLIERAERKRATLAEIGMEDPTLADAGLERNELLEWYFEDHLGRTIPADLDEYTRALGFDSWESFERSLLREYCFVRTQRVTVARGG